MIKKQDNSGAAFPHNHHEPSYFYTRHEGLSIREYFAAKALAGMLAHSRNGCGYKPRIEGQNWHDAISEEAYEIADAMLAARQDKNGPGT